MRCTRAVIVDDEPFVRADMRQLLACHPDIQVVGEAGTLDECERVLRLADIDVVFLDIQLRGCSGFEVIPLVKPSTEVIFVTAFDKYAVRAFEVNALDYLLKPVTPERMRASLERLRARMSGLAQEPSTAAPLQLSNRVFIKTDTSQQFVAVQRIGAVTALGGNYTEVHFIDSGEYPAVRQTLKDWERILPMASFARIHRNAIVNLQAVERMDRSADGGLRVSVTGCPTPFEVSRRTMADFKRMMSERTSR